MVLCSDLARFTDRVQRITAWIQGWRDALLFGEQPEWISRFAIIAMTAMDSPRLIENEILSLFDQIIRLSYHRPFSAEEDVAFGKVIENWGDKYLPLYRRDPFSAQWPLPTLPITLLSSQPNPLPSPPNSQHTSSEEYVPPPVGSPANDPIPHLSPTSQTSPPPKKRGRKPKNPDAPPEEKRRPGRPKGAVDKEKRLSRGTLVGKTKAEKKRFKRDLAAQNQQQPTRD